MSNPAARSSRRRLLGLAAIAALGLVLAGCGGGMAGMNHGSGSGHNAADVAFVNQMIPHHEQAVEMAKLAETRAQSSKVKDLATRIQAAQDPEIATMRGFLKTWGLTETTMAAGHDMANMGDAGGSSMTGMMSADELKALASQSGVEFDRMFLMMMTEHHNGAIAMAKTELEQGQDAATKTLATAISTAQEKEVTEMAAILGELAAP